MDIQVLKRWRKRLKRHGTPIRLSSGEKRLADRESVVIAHYEPDTLILSGAVNAKFHAWSGTKVFIDGTGPMLDEWVKEGGKLIYIRSRLPNRPHGTPHRLDLRWDTKSNRRWCVNLLSINEHVRFKCPVRGGTYCNGVIFFL